MSKNAKEYERFQQFKAKYATAEYLQYGQVAHALKDSSGSLTDAAKILGISFGSIKKFVSDNPAIEQVILLCKDETTEASENLVRAKIDEGDLSAAKFWLQNQAKDKGWTGRTEITGKDGKDLYSGATEEDKAAIIAQYMASAKKAELKKNEPDEPIIN